MRKLLIIAVASVIFLTGCSTGAPSIEYNKTAISDIRSWEGETVSVIGYMAVSSPYDGSCVYLMDIPLCAEALKNKSNSTITDTIICYPTEGTNMKFTEKCVRMTGTLALEENTACLKDCSYAVVAPTEEIQDYNDVIASGIFASLDSWICKIQVGLQNKAEAEKVSQYEYESEIMNKGSVKSEYLKTLINDLMTLTEEYNTWIDSSDEVTVLQDAFSKVQKDTVDWLASLRVTGVTS